MIIPSVPNNVSVELFRYLAALKDAIEKLEKRVKELEARP